jgi:nucleotide-binding universal stress UspA family protein
MSDFLANKTILVPYDFSEASTAAVDAALGMADESARFYLLHVLVPLHMITIEPGTAVNLGSESDRIEGAISRMQELINDPNKRIKFAAKIGDPGSGIVDFAKEVTADLIVMPSHGRTGIKRLLLGSVAERVVRLAECPVMVLRQPKHADK